jgi:hypothetical protein
VEKQIGGIDELTEKGRQVPLPILTHGGDELGDLAITQVGILFEVAAVDLKVIAGPFDHDVLAGGSFQGDGGVAEGDLTPSAADHWVSVAAGVGPTGAQVSGELVGVLDVGRIGEGECIGAACDQGVVDGFEQGIAPSFLHVILRFRDEPYAGKGIRHWLKSEESLPRNSQ